MVGKVFDRIESIRPIATKTERSLIEKLKELNKADIIYMSITDLADTLGAAEATILRFCRKLEYKGFQDFKLSLSQDIATESDDVQSAPKQLADSMCDAIMQTFKQIDYEECKKVADKIIDSKKNCIFAVGNSLIAALAAKNRLIKAGINMENTQDTHSQAIITANLSQEDFLILISVSGATKDIINLAEIAKKNGTPIAVITNYSKSPLAKYANYLLYTSRKEAAYEGGSLATVVAQSYIVDVMCTAVFERLGKEAHDMSIKASTAVSDKSL